VMAWIITMPMTALIGGIVYVFADAFGIR
jgi:phosphate/sulfate permease